MALYIRDNYRLGLIDSYMITEKLVVILPQSIIE
jgi:hypothetical protein